MKEVIEMKGRHFGRLTVVDLAPSKTGSREARWLCKCTCGKDHVVTGTILRAGQSKSCGCMHREIVSHPAHERHEVSMRLQALASAR